LGPIKIKKKKKKKYDEEIGPKNLEDEKDRNESTQVK
jgi:hypothetical protein